MYQKITFGVPKRSGFRVASGNRRGASGNPNEPFKVAMVLLASIDDQSWGTAGYSGIQRIAKIPNTVTAYIDRVPLENGFQVIKDFAINGIDLVLGHGEELSDAIQECAALYPEVLFACANGRHTARNLAALTIDDQKSGYLAGVVAAKTSKSGVVGFISGKRIPPAVRHLEGYRKGAGRFQVYTLEEFTGDFFDAHSARAAAAALILKGADIIYYYLSSAKSGVLDACKAHKIHAIGSITDHYYEAQDVIITSTIQDFGALYLMAATLATQGKLRGKIYNVGFENNNVARLAPMHNTSDNIVHEVEAIKKELVVNHSN